MENFRALFYCGSLIKPGQEFLQIGIFLSILYYSCSFILMWNKKLSTFLKLIKTLKNIFSFKVRRVLFAAGTLVSGGFRLHFFYAD